MHRLTADRTAFAFRPDAAPALRVQPGETIRFETSPAPAERLFAAGDRWLDILDVRAINAVTGPVFIDGVEPGDAVAIEIVAIEPADWGWNAFIPGFGLADGLVPRPMLRCVPIHDGRVWLTETLDVPLTPMIGCLGLAPASGETSTLGPAEPWGGNLDLVQIRSGATVLLPAQVPGGLASLGDLHAAMGVGEATSVAIECAGAATVRLDVRRGARLETPRIETPDRVWTAGIALHSHYDRARTQAVRQMERYLTEECGLEPATAFLLLSAAVDLEFGGPAGAIVLASIPTRFLPDAESASRQIGKSAS
jgi:amidase